MATKSTGVGEAATGKASGGAQPEAKPSGKDIAFVHGTTADGKGLAIIRQRDDRIELASAIPLESGKPIHGEVVCLKPRPEFPLICDVEVQVPAPEEKSAAASVGVRKGPAQIASSDYRRNWDAIWKRPPAGLPN